MNEFWNGLAIHLTHSTFTAQNWLQAKLFWNRQSSSLKFPFSLLYSVAPLHSQEIRPKPSGGPLASTAHRWSSISHPPLGWLGFQECFIVATSPHPALTSQVLSPPLYFFSKVSKDTIRSNQINLHVTFKRTSGPHTSTIQFHKKKTIF